MICWLQITSGRGPDECCWVAAQIVKQIVNEALSKGYKAHILQTIPSTAPDIFKSALVAVEGEDIHTFISTWEGTIQWIGKSMFRPDHKRKNWFAGVNSLNPPEESHIKTGEIKVESMKSSGPGGQHVNKTESAIRVTHIPTGVVAVAREERSQHLNRKLALSRLYEKIKQDKEGVKLKLQKERWSYHNELERGNPVRVYKGSDFTLKKS
ncbi:peptide chain release factor H [Desulfamplus magnetovallimortis]|nr:peptide chain release factor H [Desulfamplus magnetovallimortis]